MNTINIEGKDFTIEQLKDLINKNENNLTKVYTFNNTTEDNFNKKWEGFEDHEKYTSLLKLIVNFYNKGEKPNWSSNTYKYYPIFIMEKEAFRYGNFYDYSSLTNTSARLCFLKKSDMLEAIELYLDVYKKAML
jgi:hypothetical protein